eukprot:GHVH01015395.1.p1 GENE.GHVH01015395.1~~GHVH01015395.1.p1  ORF type:complete len:406 (+),score=24.06 GHVH01015395.1:469-1686(+)
MMTTDTFDAKTVDTNSAHVPNSLMVEDKGICAAEKISRPQTPLFEAVDVVSGASRKLSVGPGQLRSITDRFSGEFVSTTPYEVVMNLHASDFAKVLRFDAQDEEAFEDYFDCVAGLHRRHRIPADMIGRHFKAHCSLGAQDLGPFLAHEDDLDVAVDRLALSLFPGVVYIQKLEAAVFNTPRAVDVRTATETARKLVARLTRIARRRDRNISCGLYEYACRDLLLRVLPRRVVEGMAGGRYRVGDLPFFGLSILAREVETSLNGEGRDLLESYTPMDMLVRRPEPDQEILHVRTGGGRDREAPWPRDRTEDYGRGRGPAETTTDMDGRRSVSRARRGEVPPRRGPAVQPGNRGPAVCRGCQKPGHLHRACPDLGPPCKYCGNRGHSEDTCRLKERLDEPASEWTL